jgi:sialate O-acetylesterase
MRFTWKCLGLIALGLAWAPHAGAAVTVPGLFTSGAVLQRDQPVPVWGWAAPGEEVTVTLDTERHQVKTGADGKWQVKLAARPAGGPHTLTIAGTNTIRLTDVLFGEVWLCAGQSNMAWCLVHSSGGKEAIANSANSSLRLFTHTEAPIPEVEPASACAGSWAEASPKTTTRASAVAYYFGRQLQQDLRVPVGLIYYAVGASVIESWTSHKGLE